MNTETANSLLLHRTAQTATDAASLWSAGLEKDRLYQVSHRGVGQKHEKDESEVDDEEEEKDEEIDIDFISDDDDEDNFNFDDDENEEGDLIDDDDE